MSHFCDSEESCTTGSVVLDIIDGKPWKARRVGSNNLRQHCRILGRTFRGPHPLTDPLRRAGRCLFDRVSRASDLLAGIHPSELSVVPALVRMAAYFQCWTRDPESWSPDAGATPRRQLDSLAGHLFAKWPMPAWFGSAWLVKGDLIYLERNWYCHVAGGGSLRSAAGMPPSISSRVLHLCLGAPADLQVRQALRWAQVKALGGGDDLLDEVFQSRMLRDLSNDAIWTRLLEKVIAAKHFDLRDFGLIADTLVEAIRNDGWKRAETLVNLPLGALLGHSRRFWNGVLFSGSEVLPEMAAMNIGCRKTRAGLSLLVSERWTRMTGIRAFTFSCLDGPGRSQWVIDELTCQAQLIAESRAMRHCVGAYRRKCLGGRSSIFSLRRIREEQGKMVREGRLTIEVDRQSRRILQVRGRYNRSGNPEEIRVLRKWAIMSGLRISG